MKKYKDLTPRQKKWLDDNCYVGSSGLHEILSAQADIGFIVRADEVVIPKAIFPEEYDVIIKAQHQVLKKLQARWYELTSELNKK